MQDAAIAPVLRKYDTSDLAIMFGLRQLQSRAQAERVFGILYNTPGNDQPESSRDVDGAPRKHTRPPVHPIHVIYYFSANYTRFLCSLRHFD